jgi:hypothetical protein
LLGSPQRGKTCRVHAKEGKTLGARLVMPCPDGAIEPPPPREDQLEPLARRLNLTLVPLSWS